MRWPALLTVLVALALPGPAAPAAPPPPPAASPPREACPEQLAPPPPAAEEELPAEPLPRPAEPVGGPQLGTCGEVGTAGAPVVGAASWVLADLDTGGVLAARAPHARHRPASTLKVLTALLTLRDLDPATVVEGAASDQRVDGSRAGIGPGGQYTVAQLLDGLLLNSGNDTAEALARTMGGDAATTAAMSGLAHDLGALDTRPATSSGLDGPGMSCSAYDLALLFRDALRDPRFAATTALHSVPFPGWGEHPGFVLSNSNRLLENYPGALGGKAGFTDAARHTLVGAARRDGRRLVVALMRGEQTPEPMWKQAGALLDWGFAQPPGTPVGTLVDTGPPDPTPPPTATPVLAGAPDPRMTPAPTAALRGTPGADTTAMTPVLVLGAAVLIGVAAIVVRRRRRL